MKDVTSTMSVMSDTSYFEVRKNLARGSDFGVMYHMYDVGLQVVTFIRNKQSVPISLVLICYFSMLFCLISHKKLHVYVVQCAWNIVTDIDSSRRGQK